MQKRILLIMFFMTGTINYSQNPCPDAPTVTYAGKTYNTVQIGTQCWFKENLDVGTQIKGNQNQSNNGIIEKYCYINDPNNCTIYGGLYQWNEAMAFSTTPGTKGICPDGWHIPTKAETVILASTVNNSSNALKAIGQGVGSGAGTNTSGFTGLIAGYRDAAGPFYYLGVSTFYWSSTNSYARCLYYYDNKIYWDTYPNNWGISVRCLKDAGTTSVEQEEGLPTAFKLMQNYPNPFNPTTIISYQIPVAGHVSLKVYDVPGSEVKTLVNEEKEVGYHSIEFNGSDLPSGVYFYKISAGNYSATKRMMLIK